MGSTAAQYAALLKVKYTPEKVENLTLSNKPFMGIIEKSTDFAGTSLEVPIIHGNPQGLASSSRSLAQTNQSNSVSKKFSLTAGEFSASVYIGDRVMKMSRTAAGAFLQNKMVEIDGLYEQMSNDLAIYVAGNGGGARGRRASISSNTITLTDANDVCNFEIDMYLRASDNDGSDAAHALRAGTAARVTAVDREAGTVTVDNAANITSFANNDYLFRDGDFAGNTATAANMIKGVASYIWSSNAPPALYGMTRTSDPVRLAGCRVQASELTGLGLEDRIRKLGSKMTGTFRAQPADTLILNPEDWERLAQALSSYGIRDLKDDSTRFGYRVLEATLGGYAVKVYADSFFPRFTAFLLRKRHWKLHSMGALIHPFDEDGLTILRAASADEYEYRLKSYPVLECNAPLNNGRVALP